MREILFRGKRIDNGEWISGFLVDAKHIGDWVLAEPIHPETVGQYTELTDKNGTKIFEGDILKADWSTIDGEDMSGTFVADLGDYMGTFELAYANELEIIGNIHDNPELIGGGEDGI